VYAGVLIVIGLLGLVFVYASLTVGDTKGIPLFAPVIPGLLTLGVLLWLKPTKRFRKLGLAVVGSVLTLVGLLAAGTEIDSMILGEVENPVVGWVLAVFFGSGGLFVFGRGIAREKMEETKNTAENSITEARLSENAIMREYTVRRKRQLIVSIPIWVVVMTIILAIDEESATAFGVNAGYVGLFVVVSVVVFGYWTFRNWRCPACAKYLGRGFNPRHCPNCGNKLRS